MSIAEKLITVAENVPKVYHAGQMNVIENAECLKGIANGETIFLDDVSPVEHEIGVRVESKNLITYPYQAISSPNNGMNITVNQDGTIILQNTPMKNTSFSIKRSLRLSKGSYYFSCIKDITQNIYAYVRNITDDLYYYDYGNGVTFTIDKDVECKIDVVVTTKLDLTEPMTIYPQIERGTTASSFHPFVNVNGIKVKKYGKNLAPSTFNFSNVPGLSITDNGDGSISIKGTVAQNGFSPLINFVLPRGTYCVSGIFPSDWALSYGYALIDGNQIYTSTKVITLSERKTVSLSMVFISGVQYDLVIRPQIELGETATEYEPYKQHITYIADENGNVEGVTSLYPNTTLMTDTDGVIINCYYYKDIYSEYDRFWDIYQNNGNRRAYPMAFCLPWTDDIYNPKYDIICDASSQTQMFYNSNITDTKVTIDISATSSSIYGLFAASKIITIRKLIVSEKNVWNGSFNSCTKLKNIVIEGTIGQNGFNVAACINLSKGSWISIIDALSSITSGLSITGSLASVKKAFETSEGANDGDTSPEWEALENTKTNWTINLI